MKLLPTSTMLSVNKKGFTLIELLIVISIIGILSIIGLVLYTSFTKSARDAKRQSDLKFIQSALEDYHSDRLTYPVVGSGGCPADMDGKFRIGCPLTNASGKPINDPLTVKYITKVPNDPVTGRTYSYVPSCGATVCTSYCLYADMEGTAPASDAGCLLSGYDYGVTRP